MRQKLTWKLCVLDLVMQILTQLISFIDNGVLTSEILFGY